MELLLFMYESTVVFVLSKDFLITDVFSFGEIEFYYFYNIAQIARYLI